MLLDSRCKVKTVLSFFFNDTATTEIYTLSLHDALPISFSSVATGWSWSLGGAGRSRVLRRGRSEEHTSELQSRSDLVCRLLLGKKERRDRKSTRLNSSHDQISYAAFCLTKNKASIEAVWPVLDGDSGTMAARFMKGRRKGEKIVAKYEDSFFFFTIGDPPNTSAFPSPQAFRA